MSLSCSSVSYEMQYQYCYLHRSCTIIFFESKFSDFCQNYWRFPMIEWATVIVRERGTCHSKLGFAGGHVYLIKSILILQIIEYWGNLNLNATIIPVSTLFNRNLSISDKNRKYSQYRCMKKSSLKLSIMISNVAYIKGLYVYISTCLILEITSHYI